MNRFTQTIKVVRDVLLYVLLFVSAISYHPTIVDMSRIAGYESGTILSRYILLLFGAVFILSFSIETIRRSKLVRVYLLWLFIITLTALIVQAFFRNDSMTHELRSFIIVFGAILIGYDLSLETKTFRFIILAFCVTTLFSGLMQVMINIGGFRIANQYLTDCKNSLGAMLATSCFAFYYLSRISRMPLSRAFYLGCAIAAFVVTVTIRARMGIVAIVLIGLYYYFLIKRNRSVIIATILLFIVSFFTVLLMPETISNYLEDSFVAGAQGEDFTSGRLYTYAEAVSYLMESPFLGNVQKLNQIGWVHNFLLLKFYQYGILFAWPIVVLYFYLLIFALRKSNRVPSRSRDCFCYVCIIFPFIISLAEPTFPFGPGTVNLFNFILLGMADRHNKIANESINSL